MIRCLNMAKMPSTDTEKYQNFLGEYPQSPLKLTPCPRTCMFQLFSIQVNHTPGKWRPHTLEAQAIFHGISEEDKEKMGLADFSRHEDDEQCFNVCETCKELAARVQDSPGPKRTMNPMTKLVGEQP